MNKKEPKISIIISVAIAIVLWLYVMGTEDPITDQRFTNIPVIFENLDSLDEKDLVLILEEDFFIDLVVYGRTSEMYGLRSKLEARVDLDSIDEKGVYNLKVQISGIPDRLELRRVDHEEITVKIDRITDNTKDISIDILGEPGRDRSILYTEIAPETVSLSGPEEVLSEVDKVVGSIDISNAREDVVENVQLEPVDKNGKPIEGVSLNASSAKVSVHIGEKKAIPIEAQIISQLEDEYFVKEISISPKEITVGAKGNILKNIDKFTTEEILLDGSSETVVEEVSIQLPNNVMILNNGSNKVTVSVTIERKQKKMFEISEINQLNLLEGMDVDFKNLPVIITLEGRQEDLEKLKEEDIKLSVDLEDIGEGEHHIPVVMDPIEGIIMVEIMPKDAHVELRLVNQEEAEE